MVWGHLRLVGIRVTRERVREVIHQIDPVQTALRCVQITHRRPNSVPGPNSLWHIGK